MYQEETFYVLQDVVTALYFMEFKELKNGNHIALYTVDVNEAKRFPTKHDFRMELKKLHYCENIHNIMFRFIQGYEYYIE